jgi:hypothetical protein
VRNGVDESCDEYSYDFGSTTTVYSSSAQEPRHQLSLFKFCKTGYRRYKVETLLGFVILWYWNPADFR